MKINELLNEGVNHPALQGWDEMNRFEKQTALYQSGLVPAGYTGDANKSDEILHQAKLRAQDREYELNLSTDQRRELQQKADELKEIKRQQLRKEALEDAELAFQRAETVAQREAEMEKIKRNFEHELAVINTEHKNNMEAIRTGNRHELDKLDKEHRHEKDMFDKEAGERDKDRAERERERQQNKPQSQRPDGEFNMPEPEVPDESEEEPQDKQYQDFKADIFRLSGLPLPAPAKPITKPSKIDTTGAVDVDFKELPASDKKDDDEEDKGKPAMLPAPKKEDMARLRDLVAEFDQPKELTAEPSKEKSMSREEWDAKFKSDPSVKIVNPLKIMPKDGSYFRVAVRDGKAVGASLGSSIGRSALGPERHAEFAVPKTRSELLKDFNVERFAPTETPTALKK